jgi:pimeloyl-ACP methyl ester carboxylesterase
MRPLCIAVLCLAGAARAQELDHRPLRIPMAEAGPEGLEGLLVFPRDGARHPLAILSHGSPRSAEERPGMTALQLLPEAMEFARRGWTTALVLRRGYGTSGGGWAEAWGTCAHADFLGASRAQVADLRAAIRYLSTLPEVDASRILAVGHSAGGFATVALTADPPPGLVAAISFAGGRGSTSPDFVCGEESLLDSFKTFGTRSHTPMLWVYAENDRFFGPALARRFREAFETGGNKVRFLGVPPFGEDGHTLFVTGISTWAPLVEEFLADHHLVLRRNPLPLPPPPHVEPPRSLSGKGRQDFQQFLLAPPHRAFAVSPSGRYGWRSGRPTAEEARSAALSSCARTDCRVFMLDDALAAP